MPPKKLERRSNKLNANARPKHAENEDEEDYSDMEKEEMDGAGDYRNSFNPPPSNALTPRSRGILEYTTFFVLVLV